MFREAFDMYLATESIRSVKSIQKAEKRFFGMVEHFFTVERNLTSLDQVKTEDLQLLTNWLALPQKTADFEKEAWCKTTNAGFLKSLKALLTKAFHTERIKKNPAAYWKIPRGKSKQRRPMTIQEFNQIYIAAPEWFRPILAFIRLTGARGASVAGLTWDDVDFEQRTIKLHTNKGGGSDLLFPLYDTLQTFMLQVKSEHRARHNYIFSDRRGNPVTAGIISTTGSRLIKRCGLVGVVLYGLRHALAAELTRKGTPLEITRQVLGHSNIAQTAHYSKMVGNEAVSKALDDVRPKELVHV